MQKEHECLLFFFIPKHDFDLILREIISNVSLNYIN